MAINSWFNKLSGNAHTKKHIGTGKSYAHSIRTGTIKGHGRISKSNKTTIVFCFYFSKSSNQKLLNLKDEATLSSLSGHWSSTRHKSSGAKGLEPDAAGGYAPKAKQSLKYKWDCDIEANAIAWGNTCAMEHSEDSFRNKNGEQWGENLFTYSNEQDPNEVAVSSSNGWWAELAEKGVGQENILTDEVFARGVGHYTQMAWGTSYKLGCSVNYCSGQNWVVCQYGPSGNWGNELIYEIGDPCTDDSGCPEGATCSVDEGLCVMP